MSQYLEPQNSEYQLTEEEELKRCQSYADIGDMHALCQLGDWYRQGLKCLEQNKDMARYYYEQSAIKGQSSAQLRLAGIYEYGDGVEKDTKVIIKYLEQSVKGNNDIAMWILAAKYESGIGVKKNIKKAIELYKQSAKLANYEAQYRLGIIYYEGKYLKKDIFMALECLHDSFVNFEFCKKLNVTTLSNLAKTKLDEIYQKIRDNYKGGYQDGLGLIYDAHRKTEKEKEILVIMNNIFMLIKEGTGLMGGIVVLITDYSL